MLGRLDRAGRLISADPELEALQREAGSGLGQLLALPQIAAVAQLARNLRTVVTRPAIAASTDHDIELWVKATPENDEIALSLEGWTIRAPAGPRLAAILGGAEAETGGARNEWAADEELRIISLSPDLAELLGVDPDDVAGQSLTRVLRLEEDDGGEMPLISALAARRSFAGQHARSRADEEHVIVLSGEVVTGADGGFAGFRGSVQTNGPTNPAAPIRARAFDHALDEVLRSPLDRIIESAERIVERADGPLRSDYASYGNDIAAAARHLLSVLTSMSEEPVISHRSIDLAALAAEAAVMLEVLCGRARSRRRTRKWRGPSRERRGARRNPDPCQPDRQRHPLLARRRPDSHHVLADIRNRVRIRERRWPWNCRRRPAANLRTVRARPSQGGRNGPRPRHLAPARAIHGRRRDAGQRARRRRALHAHIAGNLIPSAWRPARSRAASAPV